MAEELLALGALVGVAAFAHFVARGLDVPPIPFFIAAGLAARPFIPEAPGLLEFVLFLSLAFLLFAAGVSLHPARFSRATFSQVALVGVIGAGVTAIAAVGLGALAGWDPQALPYLAAAVALSSTLVVLRVLAQRGEIADAHGRLLVGALLVQDALALALFALVPNLPQDPMTALVQTAGILGLAALAFAATRVARRRRVWVIVRDTETRILLAYGLVFAFMLLAGAIGVPSVAGAFLAGLAVSPFPANVHLRPAIRSAREFFTPLFFVILGAFFPWPRAEDLPLIAALVALMVLVKPVILGLVARAAGFTRRASAEAGALAGQGSEFALILAMVGLLSGHVSARGFGIIGFAVALTMVATPFLSRPVTALASALLPQDRAPPPVPRAGHVVVLGAGTTGLTLVNTLVYRGHEVVAVDVDPHALSGLPPDVPRLQGDATARDVLDAAHVATARAVVCLLRSARATEEALRHVDALDEDPHRIRIARVTTKEAQAALEARGVHVLRPREITADALGVRLDALARAQ